MIYRNHGKSGLKVSLLGFGGMRIPSVSEDEAIRTLIKAKELGINYYETAPGYGDSEEKIGRALKHIKREDILLSTKSCIENDLTGKAMRERLNTSLKRLKTDYVDFYQMWGINSLESYHKVARKYGPLEEAVRAKDEGIIKHIGFTTHALPSEILEMMENEYFESVTFRYHALDTRCNAVLEKAEKLGLGVVAMTPLCQGMITSPSEKLKAIVGMDVRDFNLRYIASRPQVSTIIAGMKSEKEVEENAKSINDFNWGEEDEKVFSRITDMLESFSEYCDFCLKCLPCPKNVNIPELLRLNNFLKVFELKDYCLDRYKLMGNGGSWYSGVKADKCNECGECIPKCPRNLPIIEILKFLHGALFVGERGRISS